MMRVIGALIGDVGLKVQRGLRYERLRDLRELWSTEDQEGERPYVMDWDPDVGLTVRKRRGPV